MTLIEVTYWREPGTNIVYREERYDDGTIVNERPPNGLDVMEIDYQTSVVAEAQGIAAWTETGKSAVEWAQYEALADPEGDGESGGGGGGGESGF